jgi:hypothetical protein
MAASAAPALVMNGGQRTLQPQTTGDTPPCPSVNGGYQIEEVPMNTETIVNLTPHEVRITTDDGVLDLPPAPTPARCQRSDEVVREIATGTLCIPLRRVRFSIVTDLPPQQRGVLLVVSRLVAEAMPHRSDLVVPDAMIRDDDGRVTGCTGLATFAVQ